KCVFNNCEVYHSDGKSYWFDTDRVSRAMTFCNIKTIKICIEKGFDLDARKNCMLCAASDLLKKEMVEFLLEQGADIDMENGLPRRLALARADPSGGWPYRPEAKEIVRLLIARGAKLELLEPALRVQ